MPKEAKYRQMGVILDSRNVEREADDQDFEPSENISGPSESEWRKIFGTGVLNSATIKITKTDFFWLFVLLFFSVQIQRNECVPGDWEK